MCQAVEPVARMAGARGRSGVRARGWARARRLLCRWDRRTIWFMEVGSAGPRARCSRLLKGGRIFAPVALGGGLLICLKTFQPWVAGSFAADGDVGISGTSRVGPVAASVPIGKLILALCIVVDSLLPARDYALERLSTLA